MEGGGVEGRGSGREREIHMPSLVVSCVRIRSRSDRAEERVVNGTQIVDIEINHHLHI